MRNAPGIFNDPGCCCHSNDGDSMVGSGVMRTAAFACRDDSRAIVFYSTAR